MPLFNPFALLEARFMPAFKQKGVVAFVQQTYERGRNLLSAPDKPSYLLAHYHELHIAKNHFDTIARDPNRRLFLVEVPGDWAKLLRLSEPDAGSVTYVYLKVKDAERKARRMLDKKLHAYIDGRLGWHPGRSTVQFNLEFTFGEIYAVLRLGALLHKVKIDEIENMHGYVL